MGYICPVFIAFVITFLSVSARHQDGHRLLHDLLATHEHEFHSKLRPVNYTADVLSLSFGVALNQVIEVNEYHQVRKHC